MLGMRFLVRHMGDFTMLKEKAGVFCTQLVPFPHMLATNNTSSLNNFFKRLLFVPVHSKYIK